MTSDLQGLCEQSYSDAKERSEFQVGFVSHSGIISHACDMWREAFNNWMAYLSLDCRNSMAEINFLRGRKKQSRGFEGRSHSIGKLVVWKVSGSEIDRGGLSPFKQQDVYESNLGHCDGCNLSGGGAWGSWRQPRWTSC